jgi:hypothetical protein
MGPRVFVRIADIDEDRACGDAALRFLGGDRGSHQSSFEQ